MFVQLIKLCPMQQTHIYKLLSNLCTISRKYFKNIIETVYIVQFLVQLIFQLFSIQFECYLNIYTRIKKLERF